VALDISIPTMSGGRHRLNRAFFMMSLMAIILGEAPPCLASATVRSPIPVAISVDSRTAALGLPAGVTLIDLRGNRIIRRVANIAADVRGITPCTDGKSFVVATSTTVLRLQADDAYEPRQVHDLKLGQRVAVSPSCDSIAIFGSSERAVEVKNLRSADHFSIETPLGTSDACFDPQSAELVVLSTSGSVGRAKGRYLSRIQVTEPGQIIAIGCLQNGEVILSTLSGALLTRGLRSTSEIAGLVCDMRGYTCAQARDGKLLLSIRNNEGALASKLLIYFREAYVEVRSHPLPNVAGGIGANRDGSLVLVVTENSAELLHLDNLIVSKTIAMKL
jgi:hypothetical protein